MMLSRKNKTKGFKNIPTYSNNQSLSSMFEEDSKMLDRVRGSVNIFQ